MSRARILSPLPMLTLALLAGCASAPKAGTPGPDAKLEAAYAEELAPATPEEIAEIERADALTRANFWAGEFRKDPTNLDVTIRFTSVLREIGSHERAIDVLTKTIPLHPKSDDLQLIMGRALLSQNRTGEAAEAFYRAGALVFGGGHVVLPLLEEAVVGPGWVNQEQFLAGYGAAQAIPGPMFAFSAYLGAEIPTGHAAVLCALVALVFMFLPGFLLVSAVLPAWDAISRHAATTRAIAGVNAAVVGLLGAALYDPIFTSAVTGGADLAIALIGFGLLALLGRSPLWVVLWCVAASVAMQAAGLSIH